MPAKGPKTSHGSTVAGGGGLVGGEGRGGGGGGDGGGDGGGSVVEGDTFCLVACTAAASVLKKPVWQQGKGLARVQPAFLPSPRASLGKMASTGMRSRNGTSTVTARPPKEGCSCKPNKDGLCCATK